jgi:hypothetical protein
MSREYDWETDTWVDDGEDLERPAILDDDATERNAELVDGHTVAQIEYAADILGFGEPPFTIEQLKKASEWATNAKATGNTPTEVSPTPPAPALKPDEVTSQLEQAREELARTRGHSESLAASRRVALLEILEDANREADNLESQANPSFADVTDEALADSILDKRAEAEGLRADIPRTPNSMRAKQDQLRRNLAQVDQELGAAYVEQGRRKQLASLRAAARHVKVQASSKAPGPMTPDEVEKAYASGRMTVEEIKARGIRLLPVPAPENPNRSGY